MIRERVAMCIKFSLSLCLMCVYLCLFVDLNTASIWQDDEATLSEEEELAKKDGPDPSDEVIYYISQ